MPLGERLIRAPSAAVATKKTGCFAMKSHCLSVMAGKNSDMGADYQPLDRTSIRSDSNENHVNHGRQEEHQQEEACNPATPCPGRSGGFRRYGVSLGMPPGTGIPFEGGLVEHRTCLGQIVRVNHDATLKSIGMLSMTFMPVSKQKAGMPAASSRPFTIWASAASEYRATSTRLMRKGSSRRAAHRQPLKQQCRLADAGGHALAGLAAHADALVERQVVADATILVSAVGPSPISVAPLIGSPSLPSSIL